MKKEIIYYYPPISADTFKKAIRNVLGEENTYFSATTNSYSYRA